MSETTYTYTDGPGKIAQQTTFLASRRHSGKAGIHLRRNGDGAFCQRLSLGGCVGLRRYEYESAVLQLTSCSSTEGGAPGEARLR